MLSLNGITNYGDVHADTLNVKNATGTGWDDVKTLIAAAGGGGGLTNAEVTALVNAALTAYTNTVGLNTLLAAYTNTTALNTLLAAYTNTTGLTTLLAGKQATLTTPGAGVFLSGTTLSGYGLRWNASNVPTGIIQELHWSNYTVNQTVNFGTGKIELTIGHPTDMATQTQLATKQNQLNFQSEINPTTNLDLSNETANPPVYIANWANTFINATGYQSVDNVYKSYTSLTVGATIYFHCEFRAGTTSSVILSVNDTTSWTGVQHTTVTGLSTTTWKTVAWTFTVYSNGSVNFHIGPTPPGVTAVPAGNVHIRNYRLSTTPNISAFTSKLTVANDIVCASNISCLSLVQTSDENIKKDIEDASLDDLMGIFEATEVKTYSRTDVEGKRLGFIAQDIQKNKPKDINNLVFMSYQQDQPLLALDYSRLVAVLWGVCKNQQKQIDDLIAKVNT